MRRATLLLVLALASGAHAGDLSKADETAVRRTRVNAGVTAVFLVLVTLAEVSFALWLVFRGPRPAAG